MAELIVKNVPNTFMKQFGKTVDFNEVFPFEWDGMDWCYNGEVIPTKHDIEAIERVKKENNWSD